MTRDVPDYFKPPVSCCLLAEGFVILEDLRFLVVCISPKSTKSAVIFSGFAVSFVMPRRYKLYAILIFLLRPQLSAQFVMNVSETLQSVCFACLQFKCIFETLVATLTPFYCVKVRIIYKVLDVVR